MPDGGLINIGELSKPATVLIEKIAGAVGVLFEPRRITREAKARAEAALIQAKASIEIGELEQRAIDRFVHQEARKQENIERIAAGAVRDLPDDANVEALDEDWVANFFRQCENVSDAEMQSLWSRLLSGEATKPGTFSKRTVAFVSTLEKRDAELFTTFCQFVWQFGNLVPLVLDVKAEIYTEAGISFNALRHLDDIGLISFETLGGYSRRRLPKAAMLAYFGRPILIEFANESENELRFGHALLTRAGEELAPICGARPNDDFYGYVVRHWYEKQRLVVSTPLLEGARR